MPKLLWIILIFMISIGCEPPKLDSSDPAPPSTQSELSIKSLGTGTTLDRQFELHQISKQGMRDAYVQWFPPAHQPGPVVIHMQPYYGISWSQNDLDNEWANRTDAAIGYDYQDINGPSYDPAIANKVHYQLLTPEKVAEESAPYLLNNVGVLIVYGRFYAGGSISETLQSVQLALQFLNQQSTVDKSRVGIFGFSFGGFQALYGAAQLPTQLIPQVGVAWAPLSDFEKMDLYANQQIPAQVDDLTKKEKYAQFFNSYLRRTYATTGGSLGSTTSDFKNFNSEYLISQNKTHFLLLHNEWDTLIPVQSSKHLAQQKPEFFEGYWFPQSTAANPSQIVLSHQLTEDAKYLQSASVFTQSFILPKIMDTNDSASIRIIYSSVALKNFFSYLRAQQIAAVDISLIKDRLLTLTDHRILMIDTDQQMPTISGSEYVSWALHIYWGIHLEPAEIANYLQSHDFPTGFTNAGVSMLTSGSTDSTILFNPSAQHLYRTCNNTGCSDPETLLVFFPGSNGLATDFQKLITVMSDYGIPTIALQYENTNALNSICVVSSKTVSEQNLCFEKSRSDRINGASSSAYVSSPADGILSRLIKALQKLHWYQFLKADGTLHTQKIIFGGFSQGSGMAAWIGKSYPVKRVCQFAGTWDYTNDFLGNANSLSPANWLSQSSQTSPTLFFGFSHQNDSMTNGITYLNVLWNQMGMVGSSAASFVALASNPSGQKIYSADSGGQCATNAHSCTVADPETPIDSNSGEPVFKSAWKYSCLGVFP